MRFPLQEHNVELPITKLTKLDFQRRLAKRTHELPHNGAQSVHARLQTCNATVSYIRYHTVSRLEKSYTVIPCSTNLLDPLDHGDVQATVGSRSTTYFFVDVYPETKNLAFFSCTLTSQYDTQSNCTGCCALLCPISCHRCNRSCNGRTWKCRRWKCRQMPLQETRNLLSRCAPRFAL